MPQFNDIFAFIEVDGQELPQYGIDIIPEENTVTCWVASQPDKVCPVLCSIYRFHTLTTTHQQHFSLTYGHTRQNDTFHVRITTDGLRRAKYLKPSKTGTAQMTVIGVSTSPTSVRPYMFSRLHLTGTLAP